VVRYKDNGLLRWGELVGPAPQTAGDTVRLIPLPLQCATTAEFLAQAHVLGSNYFCYVRDPWGSYCEYSSDIDYVPEGYAWPSGDFQPEDSLYLWGPSVPSDFVTNTEVHDDEAANRKDDTGLTALN
jgi:hypothetical protein